MIDFITFLILGDKKMSKIEEKSLTLSITEKNLSVELDGVVKTLRNGTYIITISVFVGSIEIRKLREILFLHKPIKLQTDDLLRSNLYIVDSDCYVTKTEKPKTMYQLTMRQVYKGDLE